MPPKALFEVYYFALVMKTRIQLYSFPYITQVSLLFNPPPSLPLQTVAIDQLMTNLLSDRLHLSNEILTF